MPKEHSVVPLESNPEVFTVFARKLGLSKGYSFIDIYSLTDPDLIGFTPAPVKAIILLFPMTETSEKEKNEGSNSEGLSAHEAQSRPVWFKQTIKNACGLYAILHSLSNNKDVLEADSELQKYLTRNVKPNNMYEDEVTNDFVVDISDKNVEKFTAGQTDAPSADSNVNLHFITFIQQNNDIYELDGRRPNGAKLLGKKTDSSSDNLLQDKLISERVQWYMDNANEENKLHFSLLGLAPSWD